jgi:N-6 DNA methylase
MTDSEQREAARQFANRWNGRGNEDEDGRSYWLELLTEVLGLEHATAQVNFEKKVVVNGNTKRIDAYLPETHVLIEQKSRGKRLDQKIHNSGDIELTPYEQESATMITCPMMKKRAGLSHPTLRRFGFMT